MPKNLRILAALAPLLAAAVVLPGAAQAQIARVEKATLALHADRTAYETGATARVEALVTIEPEWHVNAHEPTFEYLIPTRLDLVLPAGWTAEKVSYPDAHEETFAFADQPLAVYDGSFVIRAELAIPADTPAGEIVIPVALDYQACDRKQCLPPVTTKAELRLTIGAGGQPNPSYGGPAAAAGTGAGTAGGSGSGTSAGTTPPEAPGRRLGFMLFLALVGGLILNAMPCVLPILSLKVFGLVHSAGHGRAGVASGALATAAGILVSFWALAGAAIAAAAAGAAVGWGVQFQRPGFVTFLAVVVVLFCLNLWGLFEIQLPMAFARLGASGRREGVAGHFASGLFATLMATPCSAPFLGTAIGFALAQKAPVIVAIFTAVGVGMSLPYLLLAAVPAAARILPRPGAWMETVRGVMGFLLAGAAVWLFYVLAGQVSPERLTLIKLSVVGIAFVVWLWQRGGFGPGVRRTLAAGLLAVVALPIVLAAAPRRTETGGGPSSKPAGLIEWVAFDRRQAESIAGDGRLVFVDVTADWCFTCKVNERLVLDTPETAALFAEHRVLPMKADWTNRDDEIGKFLAEHGRYGIPFYLLYRPGSKPHVFSELITKEAIAAAVGGRI
jgi:suppressor for copper-sensitivity B